LKILFVIPSITNYFTFLEDLVNALIDAGEEVHLATSTQHISDINCYQRELRCTLHDINFPRGFAMLNHLKAAKLLNEVVTEIKPDLINVHFSAAIFTAALAKNKKWPKTSGTFHGLSFPIIKGWQKLVIGSAEKWSARQMDVVYVLTEDDRETLAKSVKKGDIRTFRSFGLGCNLAAFDKDAISPESAKNLRLSLGIAESDFVFIFIGRQVHFKGFDKIIKSFMSLYQTHPNFKLILVGAQDHIHSNNLNEIEMKKMKSCPGIISVGWKENVNEYLNISDVNVFPSIREGLPVNLMESLAMGVPVITINSRGCRDVVIHQIDGIVLEENTVAAFSQAMLLLYHDRELLHRLSKNCLRARNRFHRNNFIEEQFEISKEFTTNSFKNDGKVHA
jgi:glycosyltransferase involved in cell wall biosynthesis